MANIQGFTQVNDLFGHIFGMVPDALQALRDHHMVETKVNILRMLNHMAAQLLMYFAVKLVDFFVVWNQLTGGNWIHLDKTIKRAL